MAEYIVDARPSDLFGIKMTGLLVRCKDCRKNGSFDCPLFTDAVEMEMDEDWYCADGERK